MLKKFFIYFNKTVFSNKKGNLKYNEINYNISKLILEEKLFL